MRRCSLPLFLTSALLCASVAAQPHEVKMLTCGATRSMLHESSYLQIAPTLPKLALDRLSAALEQQVAQ